MPLFVCIQYKLILQVQSKHVKILKKIKTKTSSNQTGKIEKKKKKLANETVKIEQTQTTVTKLLYLFPFTFFIYKNIHCTYNIYLYYKYIKIGKCYTHLQNLYNFFFFLENVYNICHFLCVDNVSLHYKYKVNI